MKIGIFLFTIAELWLKSWRINETANLETILVFDEKNNNCLRILTTFELALSLNSTGKFKYYNLHEKLVVTSVIHLLSTNSPLIFCDTL